MRIAMVSEHASPLAEPGGPDAGGQNVHVRELSLALARAGHDVVVHTRRDDPDLPAEVPLGPGVRVHHLDAGPPRPVPKDDLLPVVPALERELRAAWLARPPDVAHAHFWMSGLAALGAARVAGLPVVQTFHALGHVKRREQARDDTSPDARIPAERRLARAVDGLTASCEDELFELLRLGADRRRVSVVPCGVDTAEFSPGPAPGTRRILCLGRLVRRKGIDELVAALAEVPAAELLVAGGGRDDPGAGRLRACAREAGVADRVRFLGPVARAEVPALIRSADVVVCAPWYEPFGIVPLEAMACGRPVVATAVGGMKDTVVDGGTGLLVRPRDPGAIAAALQAVFADPRAAAELGAAGRRRVLARYTWPRVAAATAGVYRALVEAGALAGAEAR
ncbi:glycosyltransferase [Pseudonocardia oroxyli]|uniref:Glycosyltransferase involved in cell wall bisynthesis n=1 Tax=Pseudonocardia oroxyli TaxID=366584 RepID=A0A1G7XR19_PSEOR|nr:glycosyltransferase [Pseudonocardia oroxyli]SDG86561.1 Glycosyltransferase involved in cell wall bisynthesis [Pseudonocardia oroxyli]